MILLTTACRAILAAPGAAATWPGPFCLAQLPGDALPGGVAPDLLFDLCPAPASLLSLLREVILRVAAGPRAWDGPVLALDDDRPPAELARLAAAAQADPGIVHAEPGSDGRTRLLLFGAGLRAHPLFLTHFRNLIDDLPEDHTAASLDLARRHLAR